MNGLHESGSDLGQFDPGDLVEQPLEALLETAERWTLAGHGSTVTYSRKVFIPLTQLCRDVCHYCTFAKSPKGVPEAYLSIEQVLEIARAGAAAGCKEALLTLGDKPELRYRAAREALGRLGYGTTLEYLKDIAQEIHAQTGLLPHLNPGVMTDAEIRMLRPVAVSMGMMLETTSDRLSARGGPHWGSPDKTPAVRLETLRAAGEAAVAMTTGLLVGIGETRRERVEALLAIRDLQRRYGHIQEVIIQNFRAKPDTRMARAPEPSLAEHQWTIAVARLILGPHMSIQAPPNLQPGALSELVRAGVNDWGGVSPVTPDHVNPEAPWPHLQRLKAATEAAGRELAERLAVTAPYVFAKQRWIDPALHRSVLQYADSLGRARGERWVAGAGHPIPEGYADEPACRANEGSAGAPNAEPRASAQHSAGAMLCASAQHPDHTGPRAGTNLRDNAAIRVANPLSRVIDRARRGELLTESEIVLLFGTEGAAFREVIRAADDQRAQVVGPDVTFVVNRNINYTNICIYKCGFCAFSKGGSKTFRGAAYLLDLEEIARRSVEAHARGATEVCLQGGIHPSFTGDTYLNVVAAVKGAVPEMHVHAFSPLEITHGARTLGMSLEAYLRRLKSAGLATLPGTAAEILDDEIRAIICPDKLNTAQWLGVMRAAHSVGLRSTATIMFGHVDHPVHWARHLLRIRALQEETGGFTEFVPLPFVHMEAPLWRRGLARPGPTFREAVLMHAVARLVLNPYISNIQTSWVKMGREGAPFCLVAGANDLGGTLMNESITRAAGGVNGQEMTGHELRQMAASVGRPLVRRTTLYKTNITVNAAPESLTQQWPSTAAARRYEAHY